MRRGSHPREVRMKHLARAAALAAVLLAPTAALSAQRELPYTYQGTVHAVKAGALDLITGVGEALRLVHMRTQPATAVVGEGAGLALGDLQPGDVVRADCRMTATGLVGDRIELQRRPPCTLGAPARSRHSCCTRPAARGPSRPAIRSAA